MFKHFRNIETAFKHVRLFTIVLMFSTVAICCVVISESFKSVNSATERVYILANGKMLEAIAGTKKENIPVEVKDHVFMFHHYFFTLDPDDKVIEANISRALYLADGSAKKQYDDLKEGGYLAGVISGNVSQRLEVDSIVLDLNSIPYYFRLFGTVRIVRPSALVKRNLITEGYLRDVSRSENNSHGFLIERWRIIDNKDVEFINR